MELHYKYIYTIGTVRTGVLMHSIAAGVIYWIENILSLMSLDETLERECND